MLDQEPAIEGGARQEAEDRRGGRPLGVEEQEHRARMSGLSTCLCVDASSARRAGAKRFPTASSRMISMPSGRECGSTSTATNAVKSSLSLVLNHIPVESGPSSTAR
ncbi:uncharacterized protein LOC135627520 isoform X1 [Musa acuminata AAA Group]|uniref:uncharacterized protein LOC108951696 isoform X1 n=1 Tax=Musa acuminata AAA Group TaxID=214697 RepID=UPI0031DA6E64